MENSELKLLMIILVVHRSEIRRAKYGNQKAIKYLNSELGRMINRRFVKKSEVVDTQDAQCERCNGIFKIKDTRMYLQKLSCKACIKPLAKNRIGRAKGSKNHGRRHSHCSRS